MSSAAQSAAATIKDADALSSSISWTGSSPPIRSAKSTSSSTISPSASPSATSGSSATRTLISTTRRPTPPGLSQIEIWFSILSTQSLNGASFTSLKELIAHIDAFIEQYNQTARPFLWTKSEVHQKRLRPCFADAHALQTSALGVPNGSDVGSPILRNHFLECVDADRRNPGK